MTIENRAVRTRVTGAGAAVVAAVAITVPALATPAAAVPAPPPPSQAVFMTTDLSPDGLVAKAHQLRLIGGMLWENPPHAMVDAAVNSWLSGMSLAGLSSR
ncbi:hypothetical protein [Tomitella fengzijianii]|uniref:Uncharacterized protein n=1 Tax=Tomitella fengzijianii TaxID=2597660 RepID=A0A516X6R9_9ACTN|nr:hypothetical protein [Tomitella fengzijianii]QDQ98768.1 hypothetical protein FO059_17290 [Tomitella fengzijianii]